MSMAFQALSVVGRNLHGVEAYRLYQSVRGIPRPSGLFYECTCTRETSIPLPDVLIESLELCFAPPPKGKPQVTALPIQPFRDPLLPTPEGMLSTTAYSPQGCQLEVRLNEAERTCQLLLGLKVCKPPKDLAEAIFV